MVMLGFLENCGFIDNKDNLTNEKYLLTNKGKLAIHFKEVHCLVFSILLEGNLLDSLTSIQLVSLFSCFTNVSVPDDYKDITPRSSYPEINKLINAIREMYVNYQKEELSLDMNTGVDYNIHYDLVNYVDKWCKCENGNECHLLLKKIELEKGIFLGEFVKALLKINNVSNELEKVAELYGNIALLSKLREIPVMTLKYVVTNQSLYV
jgi:superfamily II RNA helicase